MKKLIICLFSIFCLFSCNNDPNNSYEIIKATNNDLQVELLYNNELGNDLKLGKQNTPPFARIYSFKFRGHKYIDFDGFRRTGIVHDPDCSCYKK